MEKIQKKKIMIAKEKAKELVKNHTVFQGDDGALGEYWTDNLEAIRHASITINEIIKSLWQDGCKNSTNQKSIFRNTLLI